jgi:short-subunit dehydrogenase
MTNNSSKLTEVSPSLYANRLALITGASSGIGAVTASELASHGLPVVLVARRLERLENLAAEIHSAGGQAQVIASDLTDESDRQRLYQQVNATYGPVEVLVNNAGFGWYGYYADMPWKTALEMLQVNVEAVMHLTRLFLPDMRARKRGHIINIGSVSGSLPNQGIAIYGASKSFLDAFTTSLYREMHGTGVHVSVVRAGPVVTEFYQQAARRPAGFPVPAERFAVSAELVARRIWGLIQRPRRVIYVPPLLHLSPWLELLFGWLIDRLGPLLLRRQSAKP